LPLVVRITRSTD